MTKVFISYRRDDSAYQADRIYNALTAVLPKDHVFMDVDSIKPGDDFVEILEGWVSKCDVLLALIAKTWIDAVDPKTNRRRLENEHDFVRIEIREALKRGIPVVPVMLDGTAVPDVGQLPDDMKTLVRRNAHFVERKSFDFDVARLIQRLGLDGAAKPAPAARATPPQPPRETAEDRYRAGGRIKSEGVIAHGAPEGWFLPGAGKTEWFQDFAGGPEMVIVPEGAFTMGSPENEPERFANESPQHEVTLADPFAVGRFAVTRSEFAAFVSATNHKTEGGAYVWTGTEWKLDPKKSWRDPGFKQDDSHPVVCVHYNDAEAYIQWLNDKVQGSPYRLPSEAEWEYVCRAKTVTPFWWGSSITPKQANYDGNYTYAGGGSKGEYKQKTLPAKSFDPNPWGLYQVHGNVWEWCSDVWHDSYNGAPSDRRSWQKDGDSAFRVVRGGSWNSKPRGCRSATRGRYAPVNRNGIIGFRLARTL